MAERVQLVPAGPGDLRPLVARRRRRRQRLTIAALAMAGSVPCAATLVSVPMPRLVWNASASSPRGLYRVVDRVRPTRGDIVLAKLPPAIAALAARRGYLPAGVPLVKRVAAGPGDRVCARGARLFIDHRLAALRKTVDRSGRKLPAWRGCRRLGTDEILLLGEHPWSFDGRYAGPTRRDDVLARVVLVWAA